MKLADLFPAGWLSRFGTGPVGMGHDVATTTRATSNPSSLAIVERVGLDFVVRYLLGWKTADDRVSKAILRHAAEALAAAGHRPKKLSVDNSNEKFYAGQVKRELSPLVPVDLMAGGESYLYLGESMSVKNYLGNLLVNTMNDGRLFLPNDPTVKRDFRLLKREQGSFVAEIGPGGQHGDLFDGVKHALHAVSTPGGPAEAGAVSTGHGSGRLKGEVDEDFGDVGERVKLYA